MKKIYKSAGRVFKIRFSFRLLAITATILMSMVLNVDNAGAQNITTANLTWTIDGLRDLRVNADFPYNCSFNTNGDSQITWIQKNGEYLLNFSITAATGSWNDVSSNGEIIYEVTLGEEHGTLKFERESGVVSVTLDLRASNMANGMYQKYTVTNIQTN